ncbi:MAG: DUF2306 domain-containing protein [Pseudomonadota bacterium]
MNFEPILSAPPQVHLHLVAAVAAILIGPMALYRRSRDIWHKVSGYLWITAMLTTAITSFWISGIALIGPFSPIHLLSIFVLFSLTEGIWQIRRGNVSGHQKTMRSLYFWALIITGLATLLPGRSLHLVFFGAIDGPWPWIAVLATAAVLIIYRYRRRVLPLGKVRGLF